MPGQCQAQQVLSELVLSERREDEPRNQGAPQQPLPSLGESPRAMGRGCGGTEPPASEGPGPLLHTLIHTRVHTHARARVQQHTYAPPRWA